MSCVAGTLSGRHDHLRAQVQQSVAVLAAELIAHAGQIEPRLE
jgi:hypothetical protein